MGRAAGNAGSRTIVAVKAAATNGSKDAHRLRALCTPSFFSLSRAKRHETGAHADSDCLARLMSGLRLCTLRCGGRAHVLSHYRRRHARELQRCTRVDSDACDSNRQILDTLVWNYSAAGAAVRRARVQVEVRGPRKTCNLYPCNYYNV